MNIQDSSVLHLKRGWCYGRAPQGSQVLQRVQHSSTGGTRGMGGTALTAAPSPDVGKGKPFAEEREACMERIARMRQDSKKREAVCKLV